MQKEVFQALISAYHADQLASRSAVPGLCRVWTKEAIRVTKEFRAKNKLAFTIEAREKELEPFFWHTFLRLVSDDQLFICDGSGTMVYPPFFGLESEVPHLQGSRIDPIQYYDLGDEPKPLP